MMRPQPCTWFEIVVGQDDAYLVLQALATAGCVEVEWHPDSPPELAPQQLLAEFAALERRYRACWPVPSAPAMAATASPWQALSVSLATLRTWAMSADATIAQLQAAQAELADLELADRALQTLADSRIDLTNLARAQHGVAAALYALPADADVELPAEVIAHTAIAGSERLLLAVGAPAVIDTIARAVALVNGRHARFPDWLAPTVDASRARLDQRRALLQRAVAAGDHQLLALAQRHGLSAALGAIARATWCLEHGGAIVQGEVLARVTGWTTDAAAVARALAASGARALASFPPAPRGARRPLVLRNPRWAQPFEVFSRLVGMPGANAADPAMFLSFAVPLMFGYMFADVGQGLVLVAVGWTLRKRLPLLRLLVPGGLAAALFGWVFGSVFCREDLIAPLWLHPLQHPLPVLVVPLVAGALLLALGLLLGALQAWWDHDFVRWLADDAPVLLVLLAALAALQTPAALWLAAVAAGWSATAAWHVGRSLAAVAGALGGLLERSAQVLINTLSFARVGAFALAHAGLASVVVVLAAAAGGRLASAVVLLLGNVLILLVEGLVVSIQTTRLVLFEFFTRFFHGEGREFRPLAPPPFGAPVH